VRARLAIVLALAVGGCSSGSGLRTPDAAADAADAPVAMGRPDAAADVVEAGNPDAAADVREAGNPDTAADVREAGSPDTSADGGGRQDAAGGGVLWANVNKQGASWYGSAAALDLVANVLYYQNADGGWPKNIDMTTRAAPLDRSTIDNDATTMQLVFLAKVVKASGDTASEQAFLRGVDYLLVAQYANGGWPQFYPEAKGYQTHITFNDSATVHVLTLLRAIGARGAAYSFVDEARAAKCLAAVAKGIDCILACQIVQGGAKTG